MALALALSLLLLSASAAIPGAAALVGCPACGAPLQGRKIATVHPGEPAGMMFGLPTAEDCAQECKKSSPDVLFFQHSKSLVQGGEPSCLCLTTCYSVFEADPSEEAVIGSLCRDVACPQRCSTAPSANVIFLGSPVQSIFHGFVYAPMNGTYEDGLTLGANGTYGNGTVPGTVPVLQNGTMVLLGNGSFPVVMGNGTVNGMAGNSTVMAAIGMSYEDCRSYASAHVDPPTPFFTHLEAMSTCLLFDRCVGIAPAGTNTAKSGSFCVPSLLRGTPQRDGTESQ